MHAPQSTFDPSCASSGFPHPHRGGTTSVKARLKLNSTCSNQCCLPSIELLRKLSARDRRKRPRTVWCGAAAVCLRLTRSEGALEDRLLHLGDGLGDLDAARAGLGAVEGGAAAPHAFLVVEDLEAHVSAFVTRIEDETMRI